LAAEELRGVTRKANFESKKARIASQKRPKFPSTLRDEGPFDRTYHRIRSAGPKVSTILSNFSKSAPPDEGCGYRARTCH